MEHMWKICQTESAFWNGGVQFNPVLRQINPIGGSWVQSLLRVSFQDDQLLLLDRAQLCFNPPLLWQLVPDKEKLVSPRPWVRLTSQAGHLMWGEINPIGSWVQFSSLGLLPQWSTHAPWRGPMMLQSSIVITASPSQGGTSFTKTLGSANPQVRI